MESKKYKYYKKTIMKYQKEHKKEIARYKEKWRKENKDKIIKQSQRDASVRRFGGNKEVVLERDNWECQKCGLTQEQHILLFGRGITVHHIDGNKNNNKLENLITLCLRCHSSLDRRRCLNRK